MFKVGDNIIYGNNGACKVEAIGPMTMGGTQKEYYTLSPIYATGSKVYTPVDNKKVVMRAILTKDEALHLIDEIPSIVELDVEDEKGREQIYKTALKSCSSRELIKIIKTLYIRKATRLADGKKVTTVDEKYLKSAEDYLYGELALSLDMDKNNVEMYIEENINKSK